MKDKILNTLKDAIVILSQFPNPHTSDGAKRQKLVDKFTALVHEMEAEKTETSYEARLVLPEGWWKEIVDEDGFDIAGCNFDGVLQDALNLIKTHQPAPGWELKIARIDVTYVPIPKQ